jgi:hypothetical protein
MSAVIVKGCPKNGLPFTITIGACDLSLKMAQSYHSYWTRSRGRFPESAAECPHCLTRCSCGIQVHLCWACLFYLLDTFAYLLEVSDELHPLLF